MGWCGTARRAPFSSFEEGTETLDATPPPRDLEQSANERAHHAAQETLPSKHQRETAALDFPVCVEDATDRVAVGAANEDEGAEVVLTDQQVGCGLERTEVEGNLGRERHHPIGIERREHGAPLDLIAILLGQRVEARMETRCRMARSQDPHILGQPPIDAKDKSAERQMGRRRERRHLATSVHTGIGTTGSGDPHWVLELGGERLLHDTLDRRSPRLKLPAVVVGPEVGKGQGVDDHDRSESRAARGGTHWSAQIQGHSGATPSWAK